MTTTATRTTTTTTRLRTRTTRGRTSVVVAAVVVAVLALLQTATAAAASFDALDDNGAAGPLANTKNEQPLKEKDVARVSVDFESMLQSPSLRASTGSNHVNHVNVSSLAAAASSSSSSCASLGCEDCAASWTCHWCSDKTCHAKGSIHGCTWGGRCGDDNDDDDKKKKKKDDDDHRDDGSGCFSHKNCSACALASKMCHWCAHDNACHSVGSVYGCVTGVDCFSNDRCHRNASEPLSVQDLQRLVDAQPMRSLPAAILLGTFGLLCCCLSVSWCCATGIKGAYDDLIDNTTVDHSGTIPPPTTTAAAATHHHEEDQDRDCLLNNNNNNQDDQDHNHACAATASATGKGGNTEHSPLVQQQQQSGGGEHDDYVALAMQDEPHTPLLTNHDHHDDDNEEHAQQEHRQYRRSGHRRGRGKTMRRMYACCTACYLLSVLALSAFVYSSFRFFPKRPVYNICNDAVAWKSLVDSMTSMKVTADFEILASVANPNYFDVALDLGKGTFSHDHAFVGTFDIPPSIAKARSVTDILLVAHFTPEKWDALSITEEYYRGKLVLSVDMQAQIRVPALADYSFELDTTDLIVHVNELSDRSLCACPTWSQSKKERTRPHAPISSSWLSLP